MNFIKYHGCGNDFILIDEQKDLNYVLLAKKLCERHQGIGADGLIIVKKEPLEMLIYNSDGSSAKMCGNGIRCFAHYVFKHRYVNAKRFFVLVSGIKYSLKIMNDEYLVLVNMKKAIIYDFQSVLIDDRLIKLNYVLVGVKHLVIIDHELYDKRAKYIEMLVKTNPDLNINFVKIINKQNILVKTYEIGVGWSESCGSGCCASFYMCHYLKLCKDRVKVKFKDSYLKIYLQDDEIMMQGSATKVYSGQIEIGELDGKLTANDYG